MGCVSETEGGDRGELKDKKSDVSGLDRKAGSQGRSDG